MNISRRSRQTATPLYASSGRAMAAYRRFPSPLRYPGGKGKVANFIKLVFHINRLVGHEYVELFAGGASVALSLLFEEYASHIHINDMNPGVYAFWNAALNQTDQICQRITACRASMTEWHRQKAVQGAKNPDPLDLAFSTFFLNRTNRSGIISGGVIGGQKQTGPWKVDARLNKGELVRRIEKIARHRSRVTLTGMDAAEYLRLRLPTLPKDTVLYLDPPYYAKGSELYQDSYGHDDHATIAHLVRQIQTMHWLISYDAAPQVLALYRGFPLISYRLSYSAADRYRGTEVMFFSRHLKRPPVRTPNNITFDSVDTAVATRCRLA